MSNRFDIAIIGAGMAGASLAAEVAGSASLLLLEAEDQPGYHSTGRSAAFWSETYGGPAIQPLTTESGQFLRDGQYLRPRGALHIAGDEGAAALKLMESQLGAAVSLQELRGEALARLVPGLRPGWDHALLEASCTDIDVAALHAFYLTAAKVGGARLVSAARLVAVVRREGLWRLETTAGPFEASILVNAAGAWADEVAGLAGVAAVGIQPLRRTMVQLRVDPPAAPDMPLVIDALGRFYFKPEAGGRLWLSPHDETVSRACDCAAEEFDVALAVERLQQVVDWRVNRIEHSWAGLRSFAPDRLPVYGFAAGSDDFFWCAGQGGFGIQTAPAAARLAASLLLGRESGLPAGIDPSLYRADRFAN